MIEEVQIKKLEDKIKLLEERYNKLQGEINRLDVVFEDHKKFIYKNYSELAKTVDSVAHPDVAYSIVRR